MRRAIFPGSFDPLTLGHCEIIKKATQVFDQVIVSVGNNSEKKYMFSLDQRLILSLLNLKTILSFSGKIRWFNSRIL